LYRCELDLVHETITWFNNRGSETCRLAFEVTEGASANPESAALAESKRPATSHATAWRDAQIRLPPITSEPEPFPMFAVPREEVLAILENSRAEVLAVHEDGHAGWDWVGYRYTVRKPP